MYSIMAVDPEVKDENTCMSSSLGQVSKPKFFLDIFKKKYYKCILHMFHLIIFYNCFWSWGKGENTCTSSC